MSVTKLGTIVELPNGRVGTVVFNGLSGVGIKWGEHYPDPEIFKDSFGDIGPPNGDLSRFDDWQPEAMLREEHLTKLLGMECVGVEYEIWEKDV